jgi:hypothetical protein
MDDSPTCAVVDITMARDMSRVKSLTIGFEARCGAPGKFFGTRFYDHGLTTKRSSGDKVARFDHQETLEESLPGGLTARADVSHAGTLRYGGKGAGTFEETIAILDSAGNEIDSCHTGAITYGVKALKPK